MNICGDKDCTDPDCPGTGRHPFIGVPVVEATDEDIVPALGYPGRALSAIPAMNITTLPELLSQLRELVDRWHQAHLDLGGPEGPIYQQCAQELKAVLDG